MITRFKLSTSSPRFHLISSVNSCYGYLDFSTDDNGRESRFFHKSRRTLVGSINVFSSSRHLSQLKLPSDDLRKGKIKTVAEKGSVAVRKGATSLRDILKKYGFTFAGTYFTIWVITLSIVFGSIDSGYVDPITITDKIHAIWSGVGDAFGTSQPMIDSIDTMHQQSTVSMETESEERSSARNTVEMLASKLELWDITRPYASMVRDNPHVGNFAIAFVITKLTEVIRLPLALAIVPRISRALGQKVDEEDDDVDYVALNKKT